jgi:hypothetical protein
MRYHWGLGIGHVHAHQVTPDSACIYEQSTDTNPSDTSSRDPETLTGPQDLHDAGTAGDAACHELGDLEMALYDRDFEGWDDVESDASEAGSACGVDGSENSDYGEM